MEFRILGPVEFWSRGQRRDLGWAKERHVLAVLLMTPGKPVSTESLIRKVWDENPPANARSSLYSHVARLKSHLHGAGEDVRLRGGSGTYSLETDPENIDYHHFRALCSQARSITENGDVDDAFRLYGEAGRLWRGEPLSGLSGSWVVHTRRKLEGDLLAGTVERVELELLHGSNTDLVPELYDLVNRFRFDEKLVELLMLALYRAGRQAEALGAYRQAHRRLVGELGAEPGPGLRALHQRILQGDPALLPQSWRGTSGNTPLTSLPRDVHTFVGRTPEINRLIDEWIREDAVAVLAIDGMAGVGKTALAVHLAHRLADDYPDGVLYLDLLGYDAEHASMDPATALERLLRLLGIPIPDSLDERVARWRTALARRKVLLVLDNAIGHDQVGPLLPGAPGCLVVVTSRRRLAGLDDIHSLSLEVLPPQEGAALFGRVVGSRRALHPDDVVRVVRLCGHLPLAIQLAGSRLRHRPAWSVADLAELLGRNDRRLTEIRAGNRGIIAAFELSFNGLDEWQQRAFWRLGLHPGADITADCAAALLESDRAEAERLLDDLLDHHLISEPRRGRYRFHDLIGEYARLLSNREPESARAEVLRRVLDHYLLMADTADRLLYPHRTRGPAELFHPPGPRPGIATEEQALSWMNAEVDNLLLVTRYAADHGWTRHAALLPRVLGRYLDVWVRWAEAAELHTRAVEAWRELGNHSGTAYALADLSVVRRQTGRHEEALRLADEALTIQRALDDERAIADLLDNSGLVYWQRSEFDVALDCFEQALRLRRALADRHGQAASLTHVGIIHSHRGDYPKATEHLLGALGLYRQDGDRRGQQVALNNIGEIEFKLGNHTTALGHYEEAESVYPDMGPQNKAIWLNNVANVYQLLNRHADALECYRQALRIHGDIGDRRHEVDALNNIGNCYARMGRDEDALVHHQKALRISTEISERSEESQALLSIGGIHHRANHHDAALAHYEKALAVAHAIGDVHQEARTLDEMGTALADAGQEARAEECWRRALNLYESLGVMEAELVRARLAR
ncbi:AfsR/SARP family transcriptional regulator [Streptosporangium sp. NBC_01469]|uniref:AfsR/SARP family transcriptional regulator n=1 Tax=Streptosporangium sp. NBC_01469 TaxID=2903898 RepID=UPI002E2C37FF|nr:tetratricopeptide repeat protein [Streptosporangium sp. NBC_01469]